MMKPSYHPANQAPEAKAAIEAAIRRVDELDLDAAVREIANSGEGDEHNKGRMIAKLLFSTGPGPGPASVMSLGTALYYASARDVLDEFHDGPWTERIHVILAGVRAEAQASADADTTVKVDQVVARFRPLQE